LTRSAAGVSIVNQHPISRILLGENDNLNLAAINRLCPIRKRSRQLNINNSDMTFADKPINGLRLIRQGASR
jgi:hypothetical protein